MIPEDKEFKLQLLQSIKNILEGVRGIRYQSHVEGMSHGAVVPFASYSPWIDNSHFQKVRQKVREHTLLDEYRLFQLWELAGQVCKNPRLEGDVLEVGTWRGGSGCLMASRCKMENPSSRVFLADTFAGVAKAGSRDTHYKGGEHEDTSIDIVRNLAAWLGLDNIEILQGIFPDQTGHLAQDRQFRLCHIDVDAYQSARDVFEWVWPRMKSGGVVVFDDFGFWGCEGVTRLVQELAESADRILVHNLSGQAVFVKTG